MAISFCKESQDHLIPLCLCVLATNFFLGGCQSTTARPVDPVSQDAKISGRMAEECGCEDLVAPEPSQSTSSQLPTPNWLSRIWVHSPHRRNLRQRLRNSRTGRSSPNRRKPFGSFS